MRKPARKNKTYGLPYMGSKSGIAEWVCSYLPPAENFYDLFAGGCAVTHAALLLKNYKQYVINDLNPASVKIFKGAITGAYADRKSEWVSREDFERLKGQDEYVAYIWSFGNNLDGYMYSKDIEPLKRALHHAIFFNDFEPMRAFGYDISFLRRYTHPSAKYLAWKEYAKKMKVRIDLQSLESSQRLQSLERLQRLQSLERLQRLESLERLQRLESLERLQRLESLETYAGDYRAVPIRPNSVLYCDIPYEGTGGYVVGAFDHAAFYKWAQEQTEPCIISSYRMPPEFVRIAVTQKAVTMNAQDNRTKAAEGLFVPRVQIDKGIFKI